MLNITNPNEMVQIIESLADLKDGTVDGKYTPENFDSIISDVSQGSGTLTAENLKNYVRDHAGDTYEHGLLYARALIVDGDHPELSYSIDDARNLASTLPNTHLSDLLAAYEDIMNNPLGQPTYDSDASSAPAVPSTNDPAVTPGTLQMNKRPTDETYDWGANGETIEVQSGSSENNDGSNINPTTGEVDTGEAIKNQKRPTDDYTPSIPSYDNSDDTSTEVEEADDEPMIHPTTGEPDTGRPLKGGNEEY